jgi:hypothetical protein
MRQEKAPARLRDAAGLRQLTRARGTGTLVGLYDGEEAGLDTGGGRWQTVCEEPGHERQICSHMTLRLALSFASCPEEWCEVCSGQLPPYYLGIEAYRDARAAEGA